MLCTIMNEYIRKAPFEP
ncbi:hypothetical protein F383_12552 [Gossypium arboreum]|uniref:Uncharacterized protein n=1 Tax=Gossypium arboreum TaxID=29729 RepID=A0A0B0NGP9_GOSAR|nr:hypothetical protein F383_12552 [Gossypium arboreum]